MDSTYAIKASPPTPRLAISMIPFTFGLKSLIEAASIAGKEEFGASAGGASITFSSVLVFSVGLTEGGSNFDKSVGGPTGVGL